MLHKQDGPRYLGRPASMIGFSEEKGGSIRRLGPALELLEILPSLVGTIFEILHDDCFAL